MRNSTAERWAGDAQGPAPAPQNILHWRAEQALERCLDAVVSPGCPASLGAALRHAVFPGGARLRPQLTLLAAVVSGDADPALADAAAVAIELLHSASLVHDDLPCFDDAPTRRGLPSVHAAFGEPLALLAGDALIVHAFEALAQGNESARAPRTNLRMTAVLAQAAGATRGLVAGQAMECEPGPSLRAYHGAKTASLFEAAAVLGALAGGGEEEVWRELGEALGRAYQVADDLADLTGSSAALGKPVGRDEALGRPNVARARGVDAARAELRGLLQRARDAVAHTRSPELVHGWLERFSRRVAL